MLFNEHMENNKPVIDSWKLKNEMPLIMVGVSAISSVWKQQSSPPAAERSCAILVFIHKHLICHLSENDSVLRHY